MNRLYFMRVALNSLATNKPVVLSFPIKLEFRSVGFCKGRKTGEPEEKSSEQGGKPTTNSTHMMLGQEIALGPHWWKQALSPLCNPCSLSFRSLFFLFLFFFFVLFFALHHNIETVTRLNCQPFCELVFLRRRRTTGLPKRLKIEPICSQANTLCTLHSTYKRLIKMFLMLSLI